MNRRCRQLLAAAAILLIMTVMSAAAVFASDDNSLASLGIQTQGVVVSPEFRYDIWEYDVEVPAGTTSLALEPHTTNPSATVDSVTGTTLEPDGTGTVVITVTSESGNTIEYVLHVSQARGAVDPAEAIAANESSAAVTIDTEVVQSERETEDPRYVKVDRNSLEDAEKTIEKLQKTITEQRKHISMLTYVLYALIAVSIVFLFIVISQLLRRRDIAQELAFYKQENPGRGGAVAEDGWGDWGEDERDGSSWTDQQVGTPVQPQYHPGRSMQQPAGGREDRQRGQNPAQYRSRQGRQPDPRMQQDPRRQPDPRMQQGMGRQPDPRMQQGMGRQPDPRMQPGQGRQPDPRMQPNYRRQPDPRGPQGAGVQDETRRYEAVPPVHQQDVPRDVTKDLTRVNKAEAKAMKKAAAAEARREQEAKKAARAKEEEAKRAARAREEEARKAAQAREEEAKRAARAREEEAKRQAQEAQRIEKEQEAARRAQEEALEQAARQEAENRKKGGAVSDEQDKNVKINMIDL